VIGNQVISRDRQNVGEITDLLLDSSGRKPVFVILSAEGPATHRSRFAVSFHLLSVADRSKVYLQASLAAFKQAPLFDDRVWQITGSDAGEEIYRYPGPSAANARRRS
jgi:hypothetical protein